MEKLLVIDGNAILHRAYHAYPPLTNSKGEIVNAVYGFFMMFLSMLQDQKPEYVVVCFDRPKPTLRQAMYVGYHANRPKATDEFVSQIILVHQLLEKMNVTIFELDGYEGDDMIGTIATKAVADNDDVEVMIVTGDRDMLQLVNPRVKVLMPLVGLTKTVLFDEAAVEAKYGVSPRQFVDYKALIGDQSDGYPGVTGIGPKTASKLIQEYGTFEDLYLRIGELPEKVGLKLATDAEQASLAKKLAEIIKDAPVQFDIKKCHYNDFAVIAVRAEFAEQGFKSLLTRFDTMFGTSAPVEPVEKKSEQLGLLDD